MLNPESTQTIVLWPSMESTSKNGWLIAEPVVLLSGLFTVLVWLFLRYWPPIETLLIFSFLIPIIPSVAVVSFVIWKCRTKVSNVALIGSVALSCYSSLQFVFLGGPSGFIGLLDVLLLMTGSVLWLNASAERKRPVNN
jgi:hypothetical protein